MNASGECTGDPVTFSASVERKRGMETSCRPLTMLRSSSEALGMYFVRMSASPRRPVLVIVHTLPLTPPSRYAEEYLEVGWCHGEDHVGPAVYPLRR
jgi:hypothetical protein